MDKNIPLYGMICSGGGLNTIEFRAEVTKTATNTGRTEYYGPYDETKYPGIPVIDLTHATSEQLSKTLKITDNLRPKEEHPIFYKGSLKTYLDTLKEIGITIRNY